VPPTRNGRPTYRPKGRLTPARQATRSRRTAYPLYVRVMATVLAMALIVGIVLALVISGGH
jgi:hypothetical protein